MASSRKIGAEMVWKLLGIQKFRFGKVSMIDAEEMDRRILAFPNSGEILEWFREHNLDF